MAKRIDKDHLDKAHDYGIHVPSASIWVGEQDEIDETEATRLSKNLLILEKGGASQITIHLNTCGGDVQQALAIYDRIRSSSAHVTIIGYGEVASSGCLIMQAADRRAVYKHTHVMWHYGTTAIPETPTLESYAYFEFGKKQDIFAENIIYNAILKAKPRLTRSKFRKMCSEGIYLDGDGAKEWGLVDEVL